MKQKIIGPMGLENTRTYFPTKLLGDQMATGYGFATRQVVPPLIRQRLRLRLVLLVRWKMLRLEF